MILLGLVFILIIIMISYKTFLKIEKSLKGMVKKEDFSNINENNLNIKNECKDIQEKYNKTVVTPVAVNIPNPEFNNKFYIGEKVINNEVVRPENNSFPIKQLKYDGVFNGIKIDKNDFQKISWNDETVLNSNLHYDINKLINVPEKNIGIGYEIVNLYNWNNINNYNDKLVNINTQKDSNCSDNQSPFSDVYLV